MNSVNRERNLEKSLRLLRVFLALPILMLLWSCSAKITKSVAIEPPAELLIECVAPEGELDTLVFLKAGDIENAARAHTDYVLDVRDTIDICNSRISAIGQFYRKLREGQ